SAGPARIGLPTATARTLAGSSARFSFAVSARLAGASIVSHEQGSLSFRVRQAHLYKLVPGGRVPQEVILIGPWEYTNANVEAALNDPSIRPWTKLDSRRLSARARKSQVDELAHLRSLAYLSSGVA